MIGILLGFIGSFFAEVAKSIGKIEVRQHHETVMGMAFLNCIIGSILLITIGVVRGSFVFSLASLPTFTLRAVLEIALAYCSAHATVRMSRSSFGFVYALTIPLLLVVDLVSGQSIHVLGFAGLALIVATIVLLASHHGIEWRGAGYGIVAAILAAGTTALYKYNITYYNSVEAEQTFIQLIVMGYLGISAFRLGHRNPLRLLRERLVLAQSASDGVATAVLSFAYLFAPPSIILAGKRSSAIFWTIASGSLYFHEKHIALKLAALLFLTGGLVLLAL